MGQFLTLSRAARLVGVVRGVLQKRIREGELPSHDGMISIADLVRAYPDFDPVDSGAFERVARIKEQAFGRRVLERMLPSSEVLAQRLFAQGQELADLRRHLRRYHGLVMGLQAHLRALHESTSLSPDDDPLLLQIMHYVDQELAEVLGSNDPPDNIAVLNDVLKIMSAHVTVRPSGREFFVEGHDTLLKAGMSAGLMLNYGCGNGNCGLCKARVVSGEVRQVQHCDYVLSEAEKQQGYTLLCAHTAVSDVVLEALEASGPADIPEQRIVAKVKSIAPISAQAADTLLLHLQTPRSNRLRFLAGQNVTLGLAGGQEDFSATYPVASCPCDDRNLLFHIHRDTQDSFAERLFARAVSSGEAVSLWGPWGDFVLRPPLNDDAGRPLLFLACDGGFAPMKSLIEHAMSIEAAESIVLYWAATLPAGHYQSNQCRAWAEALDEFSYVPLLAEDAAAAGRKAVDAVCADCAATVDTGGLAAHDVYIAGPEAFVVAATAQLTAAGMPRAQLYSTVL
ncbi:MAG: 2Fe-2S iron-sulfur cluster binding domain-containing protein [Betaproteobacteria bacterium]|nr:2Fe-2S iron-sulfur cluster binding domain-containing protein [Betaproteobacteria bacterium]